MAKRISSKRVALISASSSLDKKAEDIIVLNISKISTMYDYLVIVSGKSDVHISSIREGIEEKLKDLDIKSYRIDGKSSRTWQVIDCRGAIIHIFHKNIRKFYGLENLWGDGKLIKIKG